MFKRVVKKFFFTHPVMKYMTFVAVSSFVFTTENKQGHVNQCFALTLSLRCSATSDSFNPALDSFSQGF